MAGRNYVLLLLAVLYGVHSKSVFNGARYVGDKLIHKSEHVKIPYFFIRTSDVAFPKYYEDSDNVITAIHVIDNQDCGALAEVDYGGVGLTYANVHLRSALFGGFNYTIEIYGVKKY